jgi:hypothetical protein
VPLPVEQARAKGSVSVDALPLLIEVADKVNAFQQHAIAGGAKVPLLVSSDVN